jgi:hypothetical protein
MMQAFNIKDGIMKKKRFIGYGLPIILMLLTFTHHLWAKDVTITPTIELKTVYDDNLDFDDKDEKDDFGVNVVPGVALSYASELLELGLFGGVDVIKYFNETDFDRTNQLYSIDSQYQMFPRWRFAGGFEYRRDETIDSVLAETGQAFERNRVTTYDATAGLFFQLTELWDIGFETDYRKREYGSDQDTDFDRYTFSLPLTKRFANERDTVALMPAYTIFDSDGVGDTKDYRSVIEWERKISETLSSTVNAGARYTDIDQEDGSSDTNWGYVGLLGLLKKTETFSGSIEASRDIRANSDAEIVEVNRLLLRADKRLHERFGFGFYGAGYYTDTESAEAKDEKTTYFELRPSLYYLLTENHSLEFRYEYQNRKEYDRPGNPVTQRNRFWLGFTFRFPKKF